MPPIPNVSSVRLFVFLLVLCAFFSSMSFHHESYFCFSPSLACLSFSFFCSIFIGLAQSFSTTQSPIPNVCWKGMLLLCFCLFLLLFLFLQYLIFLQILLWFLSIIGTSFFHVVFSLVWHNPSLPHNQHLAFIPILVQSFLFRSNPSQLFLSPFHCLPVL